LHLQIPELKAQSHGYKSWKSRLNVFYQQHGLWQDPCTTSSCIATAAHASFVRTDWTASWQIGISLMQVFGYLHEAWDKIGFTHGDLNCANVMEHRGDADLYLPEGFANDQETQMFKLPGMLLIPHWIAHAAFAMFAYVAICYMHIYAPLLCLHLDQGSQTWQKGHTSTHSFLQIGASWSRCKRKKMHRCACSITLHMWTLQVQHEMQMMLFDLQSPPCAMKLVGQLLCVAMVDWSSHSSLVRMPNHLCVLQSILSALLLKGCLCHLYLWKENMVYAFWQS